MSVPLPSTELEGHCSTIHDDILYVLSSKGFLSLPLKEKATWSKEEHGQLVTGSSCVKIEPDNDPSQAKLFVIGGTTDDDSFSGLQQFSFSDKKWETLSPTTNVLQGRTNHSAAYLADSQSILVYAGSQPNEPSYLSSQTFQVSIRPPYNIEAFTSEAPPANLPIMVPWNSSHAIMAGGNPYRTGIYTFGPSDGWQEYPTALARSLDPSARGSVIDGDDGSKVLQVFEMNESPNTVSSIVLQDANGQPAALGQTVGGASSSSRRRKRGLQLDNWPSYNSTGAPTATRSDCSVAQNGGKMAVIAAGSEDSPVVLFNPAENKWINADNFFNSKQQQPLKPSETSSVSAATSSSSPSESSSHHKGVGGGGSSHAHTMRTLGIALGVLFGTAVVFILILLYLRWRKLKQRKAKTYVDEKTGERLSFADRGASFMQEAGGSGSNLVPPNTNRHHQPNDSRSSLAIITGKFGNKRNTANLAPKASFESTAQLVKDKNGSPLPGEPVEMVNMDEKDNTLYPPPQTTMRRSGGDSAPPVAYHNGTHLSENHAKGVRKRSSGWSKYFAANQATGPNGLSHIPSAYIKDQHISDGSEYSIDRRVSEGSLQVPLEPPLNVDFKKTIDGQRLSQVTSGSPAFSDSRRDLASAGGVSQVSKGQRGRIIDPSQKRASDESGTTDRSTLSSEMSGEDETQNNNTANTGPRPPSSAYTASVYEPDPRLRSRGTVGFFPGSGSAYRPRSKSRTGHSTNPSFDKPLPPPGMPNGLSFAKPAEDRDSTVTVFPSGMPNNYYNDQERENTATALPPNQQQQKPPGQHGTDMSWLNLGLGNNQHRS